MRKVILYFPGDKITPDYHDLPRDKQDLALLSFGEMCEGKALRLGGIDVGTVVGYRISPHAVGLIVEWSDWIEQGQIINGGV